jgi:hypothetical protein
MVRRPAKEKHIAVFGETGSGKTTLLSVFYGHQQSFAFSKNAGYSLLAMDTTQGQKLLQTYHRIEDNLLPPQTRFHQKDFHFRIRLQGMQQDTCNLVWHDYPGEWWTETRSGEENDRKMASFKTLLRSDIALFLVDGQRLRENQNNYLVRLFKSFRDEIQRLHNNFNENNVSLNIFPRIWIICLSKADLFPGKDVEWFRKEVLKSVADEIAALSEEIKSMVKKPEYVSIGNDFLLLSSSKFDPETGRVVDPSQTVGVDLISPLSIMVPLYYARKWAKIESFSKTTVTRCTEIFRSLTTNWTKWIPIVGRSIQMLDVSATELVEKLQKSQDRATRKNDVINELLDALDGRLRNAQDQKIYMTQ